MSKQDISNGSVYNEDYFERGLSCGTSLYTNYRWIPELTIPMAMALIDHLDLEPHHKILDFGCAKGYLVKALRLLRRQAWGSDISLYAIENADSSIKSYCAVTNSTFSAAYPMGSMGFPTCFDYCIAKDVFEHIEEGVLYELLRQMPSRWMFVVVPLGDGVTFNVPVYHYDKSHIHMQPLEWWENLFERSGWDVVKASYQVSGLKENWSHYDKGNGFFTLLRKGEQL